MPPLLTRGVRAALPVPGLVRRNEPPIHALPVDWLVGLRSTLDDGGYSHTQLIAPDAGSTQGITLELLKEMRANASLQAAVSVIGTHGFWATPPPDFSQLLAEHGTRAWVSESWHQMGSWGGAIGMANKVMSAHLGGNYTGWTAWGLLFAAYPNVLCQDKGLMYATNPWGDASYQVGPTIWTVAHFTQFAKVGWRFLRQGAGSGYLPGGATYVTLVEGASTWADSQGSAGTNYSIIIDCFGLEANALNVTFTINHGGGSRGAEAEWSAVQRLQQWSTTEDEQFVRGTDIHPAPGSDGALSFALQLRKGALYSLTTLPDGVVAKGDHADNTVDSIFPLPLRNDFETTGVGRSPQYFTDWDGSFSVEGESDRGSDAPLAKGERSVLRQMVLQRPIRWHCTDVDPITIVGEGMQNYAVTATLRVETIANESSADSASYAAVYARVVRPYSGWCPAPSGYRLKATANGTWSLEVAQQKPHGAAFYATLASGQIPGAGTGAWKNPGVWRNVTLSVDGAKIEASVDGAKMAHVFDSTYDSGPAGVGSVHRCFAQAAHRVVCFLLRILCRVKQ